jgi:mannose-6-phosphate isomerase
MRPTRLNPSLREKIWGTTQLEPWFPNSREKVGEVWFEGENPLPILVKFIYTSERLSVQVHPPGPAGKTEMWHILRADPGAKIALGFRETFTRERIRKSALSGEIVDLLRWYEVSAGDTYFTPAGTVHAIGAGVVLCEIQQNNDVTYRLYDYGRPRELHLEEALAVSDFGPHPGKEHRAEVRVACDYFQTDSLAIGGTISYTPDPQRFHLLIVLEGEGRIAGERFRAGEVWQVPPGSPALQIDGTARMLRSCVPSTI